MDPRKTGLGAAVLFAISHFAPQPWGVLIFWSVLGLYGAGVMWVILRRTTMYALAVGAGLMTLACLLGAIDVAFGDRWPSLLSTSPLRSIATAPTLALFGASVIAMFLARRIHPDQLQRIREQRYSPRFTDWDRFLMRDVPDLRHSA